MKEAIKSKCREKLRVGVLFLKDNVSVHTTQIATAEAVNRGFKLLLPSLYTSD